MAYATQADMETRFGVEQLKLVADRDNDGVIDADVVTDALDTATAEVDVYLAQRYAVPISPVPELILACTCDIARYKLYIRSTEPIESVRKAYEDAMRILRDLANGIARLDGVSPAAPLVPQQGAQIDVPDRVFSGKTLRGL